MPYFFNEKDFKQVFPNFLHEMSSKFRSVSQNFLNASVLYSLIYVFRYEFEWKTQAACLPHYKVECSLFVNGKGQDEMYDLSPLSRWDTNWRALIDTYQVGYPVERKIYINVCRNIVKTKSDDTAGCLHQSGICMIRGSQK